MKQITGIVDLWNLPDHIRVALEPECCSEILKTGRQISGSYIKLAKNITEPLSKKGYPYTVMKLKYENKNKLSLIKKLVNFTGYKKENLKIKAISIYGRKRESIMNPRLPFNFNSPDGARVISSLLFDGGIKKKSLTPTYWNTQDVLRKRVLESFHKTFGEFRIKSNKERENLDFPKICGIILVNGIGMLYGKKVENNPKIPDFIFNLPHECKSVFLQQAFDDDGSISEDYINIMLTKTCNEEEHNLLIGIKKLLKELDIESHGPKKVKEYYVKDVKRITYVLTITGRDNFEKFGEKIGFLHPRKKEKLENILNKKPKERHFSWGTVNKEAIKIMKECQETHGYFTRNMIAKKLNRSFSRSQQLFKYFLNKKTITIIESSSGTKEAKFMVSKKFKVLLDTNALMIPGSFKVDIFSELEKFGVPELYTLDSIIAELAKIIKLGGRDAKAAKLALMLIEKKNVKVLPSKLSITDKELERLSSDYIVCTLDKELINKLQSKNKQVIRLVQKKYLEKI